MQFLSVRIFLHYYYFYITFTNNEKNKSTLFIWINELIISELQDNFSWKKVFTLIVFLN